MEMPKENTPHTTQKTENEGIGIVILVEDKDRIEPSEDAKALSAETGFPIVTQAAVTRATSSKNGTKRDKKPQSQSFLSADALWQLVYTRDGLSLRLSNEPSWGDIRVDFASAALNYRKLHGGGRNEAIAKAIGIKGKESLSVIDCTAGMGNDSFVMASVGAKVTMLERSPVIAALLEDAIKRANDIPELVDRLSLVKSDAYDYISKSRLSPEQALADVIYLDPMFPHKKKSALVKKEMRAFQQLLGADMDSAELLELALKYAGSRVVVKRPSYAEPISLESGRKPNTEINSKKHRFDVYIQH
jgi:16S rRNA (guanine1516-N2)-methyltransferase